MLSTVRADIRTCFRKLRRCDPEEAVAKTVVSASRSYGLLAQLRKPDSRCPLQ